MTLLITITVGVISGIVASVTYAGFKRMLRPRIKIVPKMIYWSDKDVLGVKIISRSRVRITDMKISLDFLDYDSSNGGYSIRSLDFVHKFNPVLDKYVNDKEQSNPPAGYALKVGFVAPKDILKNADKEDKFLFSIKATHPISGTKLYLSREFMCCTEDIKENFDFNSGDNYSLHPLSK